MLIYKAVLIMHPTDQNPQGVARICGPSFRTQPLFDAVYMWTHPLLRSNSQIRTEGLDTFFKYNTFSFNSEWQLDCFLEEIDEFGRERIRGVYLEYLPMLWPGDASYDLFQWTRIENYMRSLARLANLRSLRVVRSPFVFEEFQVADDYNEDEWPPEIYMMDVHEAAFLTVGLGWIPLHIRGLRDFSIDWGDDETGFNATSKAWFREVERTIRTRVTQPKPDHYFRNRTEFIYTGYEWLENPGLKAYARCCYSRIRPNRLLNSIRKPSDFYSTFAFDPVRYERQQKWRNRGLMVPHFLRRRYLDVRHPRAAWHRWRYYRRRASVYSDDAEGFTVIPPILPHMAMQPPPVAPLPVVAALLHPPSVVPPMPLQPAVNTPTLTGFIDPQQAVAQLHESNGDSLSAQHDGTDSNLDSSDSATIFSVSDGDDDEIPLESLTDPRASSSLPSLLRALNMD